MGGSDPLRNVATPLGTQMFVVPSVLAHEPGILEAGPLLAAMGRGVYTIAAGEVPVDSLGSSTIGIERRVPRSNRRPLMLGEDAR
ncbi:hypothetical protein [Natronococcus occultus]|uniref:Uncharacterized protein n=1 Tax=Natronococcus occultus SP4 TaxID=694430 RepID=L0JUE1_9EURY|nr:hypothetical protein [Natronococcus occultus]AGB36361.1 hypothetical protein Natoc_0499 [Natronococcus occultus SP4]